MVARPALRWRMSVRRRLGVAARCQKRSCSQLAPNTSRWLSAGGRGGEDSYTYGAAYVFPSMSVTVVAEPVASVIPRFCNRIRAVDRVDGRQAGRISVM